MALREDRMIYDVLIVGGGWSGLLMCKYALEQGLEPLVLEKRSNIGGVWNFSPDTSIVTVQECTSTTSSPSLTEMSDFPMPVEMGDFPHHTAIEHYLRLYATHFNLWERIILDTTVEQVEKSGEYWEVSTSDSVYIGKNVSVCSGVIGELNRDVETNIFGGYTGRIIHGGEIKKFQEEYRDKTIVIVGGGETAADILEEWSLRVKQVFWSLSKGQHFFRKFTRILPHRHPQVLDKASSRIMNIFAPFYQGKPGLSWVCNWTTNGSLLAYQGHGMHEFRNEYDFMHSAINKNGHVLDLIDYKRVVPKKSVINCIGETIFFEDGSSCRADLVINCTGYKVKLPYLPDKYKFNTIRDMYKHTLHPDETGLSFIGYIRPVVGSISQLSEMQARFVSLVWAGKVVLGSEKELKREIECEKCKYVEFVQTDDVRKQSVVEAYSYLDDLAEITGTYPNYRELWESSFREWYVAMFAPYNGAIYRLNNRRDRTQALQTMERHMKGSLGPLQFVMIILLRAIKLDGILKLLGNIKHFFQISPKFRRLKNSPFLSKMNKIWLLPKKLLFDQQTRPVSIKFEANEYSIFEG